MKRAKFLATYAALLALTACSGPGAGTSPSDQLRVARKLPIHAAAAGNSIVFPIPGQPSTDGIAVGSDRNLWIAGVETIYRVTTAGTFKEFPVRAGSLLRQMVAAPDGNVWFADDGTNSIGKITPSGMVSEYKITTGGAGVLNVAPGADGNIWFTEFVANKVGYVTASGTVVEFTVPTSNSGPRGLVSTAGTSYPGAVLFTEFNAGKIATVTTNGTISEIPIPLASQSPGGIAIAALGDVWFTSGPNVIGQLTPARVPGGHQFTYFNSLDVSIPLPLRIIVGPDNNLWFNDQDVPFIYSLTPSGVFTSYSFENLGGVTPGITNGPDGNIWFTTSTGYVGYIVP